MYRFGGIRKQIEDVVVHRQDDCGAAAEPVVGGALLAGCAPGPCQAPAPSPPPTPASATVCTVPGGVEATIRAFLAAYNAGDPAADSYFPRDGAPSTSVTQAPLPSATTTGNGW
ncbi:hypothetical protein GCM10017788_03170 [Amycolatopsis acidiphila]|nr:hypothetical protein GCM10017788_03170 [Amycolatopsis acidiphila]